MNIYNVYVEFSANLDIVAENMVDAIGNATETLDSSSVYRDKEVLDMVKEAYECGRLGKNMPFNLQTIVGRRDRRFGCESSPEVIWGEEIK